MCFIAKMKYNSSKTEQVVVMSFGVIVEWDYLNDYNGGGEMVG